MKIGTRILLAFLTLVVSFLIVGFIGYQNQDRLAKTKWWVEHTYIVLAKIDSISGQINKTESSVRAYVIMSDPNFLAAWPTFQTSITQDLDDLLKLVNDNPNQVLRIEKLRPLIESRIGGMQQIIDERKINGKEAKVTLSFKQMEMATQISDILAEIKQEESSLLQKRTDEMNKLVHESEQLMLAVSIVALFISASSVSIVIKGISSGVNSLTDGADRIGKGDLDYRIESNAKDEIAKVGQAFNLMASQLKKARQQQFENSWIKTQLNELALALQGIRDPDEAGIPLLEHLCKATDAQWGVVYGCGLGSTDSHTFREVDNELTLIGTYACSQKDGIEPRIMIGDGIVGQCGADMSMRVLTDVPANAVIKSATVAAKPIEVVILPATFEGKLKGVIELGSLKKFEPAQLKLLEEISSQLGVSLHFIKGQVFTDNLLKESQTLNEELQAQQEELESQQEELRQANEELEQRADILDQQYQSINEKNRELEQLQTALEVRANELEMASKYKSEFLANMSHDLRTPLNSLLIFSELLLDNENEHLDQDELEYAKNIGLAGKALLTLIDDILDLSKIESGTINLDLTEIPIDSLVSSVKRNFEKDAKRKNLDFQVVVDPDVPPTINMDQKRIHQLLNNLLANAFKFTQKGSVFLNIKNYDQSATLVSFSISDTGIGIDPSKHHVIFEAFQQAESNTKTKYGGTGLGLAICRKLAEIMGGTIQVQSALGSGSTFTVILPVNYSNKGYAPDHSIPSSSQTVTTKIDSNKSDFNLNSMMEADLDDDRFEVRAGDRVLLIIEDDKSFANMLLSVARKQGFKAVVALNGMDGLELARKIIPDGITLDLRLPDTDGWVVLDQLKNSSDTRHIPVHIISIDNQEHRSLTLGAAGFLEKPVTLNTLSEAMVKIQAVIDRTTQTILFVEPDKLLRESLSETLACENLNIETVETASAAMHAVKNQKFDCAIIDLNLGDSDGLDLVREIQNLANKTYLPMIIYSSGELSEKQKSELKELNKSGVIKDVHSPERLLNEAGLFLHRVERTLPDNKRKMLKTFRQDENPFAGSTMLIVDDDPRNITALSSVLQKYNVNILTAENGLDAVNKVENTPNIDLVLMDIMMPEMDGYEATRHLRSIEKFKKLPIIAVTAKAMKGDRHKCLEAGASDYITKPVDRGQLLSLLRVWLYKA